MVTPLDITALGKFQGIFPFLLVLILSYAFLSRSDWFKEKTGLAALIAVVLAFMTLLSRVAIKTINMMTPWFVLFIIFGVLMILAYMAFGIKEDTILEVLKGEEYRGAFAFWVLAIILIIGLGSLFQVMEEEAPLAGLQDKDGRVVETEDSDVGFWNTIVHPKILGMALLLLTAFFTISKMTQSG